MSIYLRKRRWKVLLLIAAIFIGSFTLWYSNRLAENLKEGEQRKMEQWAEAIRILSLPADQDSSVMKLIGLIIPNNTIPTILIDDNDTIINYNNINVPARNQERFIRRRLDNMRRHAVEYSSLEHRLDSISEMNRKTIVYYLLSIKKQFYSNAGKVVIDFGNNYRQHLYYEDSIILKRLNWFPIIQLLVVSIFIVVAYLAFSGARKAEQNQVWVGMAKETAHQLGTPTSSLLAWVDLLKMKVEDLPLVDEMTKDIGRLRTITERFSKIGAKPDLDEIPVCNALEKTVNYLKTRTSSHVEYSIKLKSDNELIALINPVLFEWGIENICKNAVDAMNGKGKIDIEVTKIKNQIQIDIKDNGKGILRPHLKTIFEPGFTTKSRGWGLGLTLVKRIIEQYHHGKIYVADSQPGLGTTFRILLNAAA